MNLISWDVLHVVVVGSVVGFMLADRAPGSVAASALLLACLLWHFLHRRSGFSPPLLAAVLCVLHLTAVWLDHTASFALFAWGSVLFAALPLRPAVLVVAALDLLPVPIAYLRDGTLTEVHGLIPLTVLGLAFAVVAGTYIARLTDQNAERAAMIAELSASRAEVARLSHEAGVLTERARLAAEIHDTLAQGFTSIITLAQAAAADPAQTSRRLEQVVATARENLAEARALVAALAPADLHTSSGLGGAVRRQLSRLAAETGLRTACHLDHGLTAVPTATQVVLLRSLQEALTNVRRHARATSVEVRLTTTPSTVVLTVTDDGIGLTAAADLAGAADLADGSGSGAGAGVAGAGVAGSGAAGSGAAGSGAAGSGAAGSGVAGAAGVGASAAETSVSGVSAAETSAVAGASAVGTSEAGASAAPGTSAAGSPAAGTVASGKQGAGRSRGGAPGSSSGGFGLAGMRSRVEQAGGVCTVDSRPGGGTTVTVTVATALEV